MVEDDLRYDTNQSWWYLFGATSEGVIHKLNNWLNF
jgi:hypothetical protein